MTEPANFRAFISIQPSPATLREVERLQRRMRVRIPDSAVKWTPPEHLHLTLSFLGDVEAGRLPELVEALRKAAALTAPLNLAVENVGAFPSLDKPNIIWAGIAGDLAPLLALQAAVEAAAQAFASHLEARRFHPHLTLARIRRNQFRQARGIGGYLKSLEVPRLGEWSATQINLMQSELRDKGPVYVCRAAVKLAARTSSLGQRPDPQM